MAGREGERGGRLGWGGGVEEEGKEKTGGGGEKKERKKKRERGETNVVGAIQRVGRQAERYEVVIQVGVG